MSAGIPARRTQAIGLLTYGAAHHLLTRVASLRMLAETAPRAETDTTDVLRRTVRPAGGMGGPDAGPGLPPGVAESLFGAVPQRGGGSTGLGLSIAP
ncbi:hypothetical protein ACFVZW_09645 [Streptomyces sp. NPDC059567]|uniref:hypothetical protein n=1 Tax=Streptomyces sp. NPDC059567 TaxID=3346867 RepID=UPI0036A2030C